MNALTGFRANSLGNLLPRPEQRKAAAAAISSMARARQIGFAKAAGVLPKSTTTTDTSTRSVTGSEMDRDAFLQLLVLQMQNQDPTAPMDNNEMLAQLAQFSSLEQMNNLNESFTAISGNIDQLNFISANSLLGKEIKAVNDDGDIVSGVVESVHLDGSIVYLGVDDQYVSMAGVLSINEPGTAAEGTEE